MKIALLNNYAANTRTSDVPVLREVLAAAQAPCTVAQLDSILERAGVPHTFGRATLAWLLKYDLLRCSGRIEA